MSQVGDALRRAGESDRNRPRQPDTQGRLKPGADPGGSSLGLWAVVVLVLASAGWFFWHAWKASHPSISGKRAPVVAISPKPEAPPGVIETAPAPSPSAPGSGSAPPATAADEAWPADLKLMGIIFSKKNPMALINGQTVGVGDKIEGIRVTKIEHDRVSVQWNGQVKELMMK